MRCLFAAIIVTALATPAGAANIAGYGFAKCRDITAAVVNEQDVTLEVFSWAAGYMSGLNAAEIVERKQYKDFDGYLTGDGGSGVATRALLAECIHRPDVRFADVVSRYWASLPLRKWAQ